ncbi:MAG: glycosyltransferase family A protein, partial [Cyclobacteriaceae bacterium]
MNNPKYSVVIPVYNRPDEVKELLESLLLQTQKNFEVIVVDDGSASPCEEVVKAFFELLSIRYYFKPNSGPGPSRNFGFEHAKGDYYIVFDSDCILPPGFFSSVE